VRSPGLRYFEDVLAVEFDVINHRRAGRPQALNRDPVKPLSEPPQPAQDRNGRHAPDPSQLLKRAKEVAASLIPKLDERDSRAHEISRISGRGIVAEAG